PLGYTGHQPRFDRSYEAPADARRVIARLDPWRAAFRERDGISWVHAADEFYLNAALEVPPAPMYDGFPQFENGIGLLRTFMDGVLAGTGGVDVLRPPAGHSKRPVVVTGTLFAPALETLLGSISRADVEVLGVGNAFFGGNVSVAGLLTGADVAATLTGADSDARYLLPSCMFNDEGLTIDGMTVGEIAVAGARHVEVHPADAGGLLSGIL
ncbi:MAG TPA: DUF512 domain-containing protein, partial [Coriobacteriia bacterium]|nr:DUF512 domain-containing protein [Coriobacteriia bacterium]